MLHHSMRKKFQGRVFCEFWHHKCCYPHLVKRYCQETSQQEVRDIILFQKTQNHDQSCCCHGEKNEPVCFSGKFNTATIQLSVGEILIFLPSSHNSQVHKSMFPFSFIVVQDASRTYSKKEAARYFQKAQKLDQSCCNEEKSEPVCFSCRFEVAIIQLPQVENIVFTIRAQFPGSQNHVSWLLQSCVKTHLAYTVPLYMRKKVTEHCECWLTYL